MELTSRQRMLVFTITVLALAGLGLFLLLPGGAKPRAAPPPSPAATATTPPAPPVTPSAQPTGSTAASGVNIYQWLPFTQQDLAQAANVATAFAAYYGTYTYSESASSYGSRMQGLATSELVQSIENGYNTPGVASLREQQKRIYTGSAVVDSLRTFGASSLTFVVTLNQKVSAPHGQSQASHQYAVTVANSGVGWQVNDIEFASAGNQ